jgi:hypothetical protein
MSAQHLSILLLAAIAWAVAGVPSRAHAASDGAEPVASERGGCPELPHLLETAHDATRDLPGTITLAASQTAEALDIDVTAESTAGDTVERHLSISTAECANAAALVAAVARRALLTLPQGSGPNGALIVQPPDQRNEPVPVGGAAPWQLRVGAGGAVGVPLGGELRARASLLAPLAEPWRMDIGVDGRSAVPVALGRGVAWSAGAFVTARAGVAFGEEVVLSPFAQIGGGVIVAGGLGHDQDRAGLSPAALSACGISVEWPGMWVEVSAEGLVPSIRVALADGAAVGLPIARVGAAFGATFDLLTKEK